MRERGGDRGKVREGRNREKREGVKRETERKRTEEIFTAILTHYNECL